jgi:His-Xaa-Ser repeat protein HxsA
MGDLTRWLSGLVAFLGGAGAAIAADTNSDGGLPAPALNPPNESNYTRSVRLRNTLREGGGWVLAAHRSHSSHSSHRSHSSHSSHYSSSGGSYRPSPVYGPPAQALPAVPPPQERREGAISSVPKAVTPVAQPPYAAASEVAKLIMRIQLALNSRGYCNCTIDGKFGQTTQLALKKFQKESSLKVTGLPDTETLQKLEVSF